MDKDKQISCPNCGAIRYNVGEIKDGVQYCFCRQCENEFSLRGMNSLADQGIFIKYGEYDHLKQIVDGKIRFAPSQNYIKIEMDQHNKGQGDLLEGKWVIHAEGFVMESQDTHEIYQFPQKAKITLGTVDVCNMPVFCISKYGHDHIVYEDNDVFVDVSADIDDIKKDFPKSTHALIILEPDRFILSVKATAGHLMQSDYIHYYDYSINDINMLSFLTTGTDEYTAGTGIVLSMTYENRYRHLLCKDKDFSNQSEYRFIVADQLSNTAEFYDFKFDSAYLLVPIDELNKKIKI